MICCCGCGCTVGLVECTINEAGGGGGRRWGGGGGIYDEAKRRGTRWVLKEEEVASFRFANRAGSKNVTEDHIMRSRHNVLAHAVTHT